MHPQLRIHQRSDDEIIAQLGAVVIRVVGQIDTTIESIRAVYTTIEAVQRQYPIAGMLVVVEHGAPVPNSDVRRYIDDQLVQHADRLITGYAMLGLGFWAEQARTFAADRSQLQGCTILVDINLEQLAERMARELVGIDPQQLTQACELLRASLN